MPDGDCTGPRNRGRGRGRRRRGYYDRNDMDRNQRGVLQRNGRFPSVFAVDSKIYDEGRGSAARGNGYSKRNGRRRLW